MKASVCPSTWIMFFYNYLYCFDIREHSSLPPGLIQAFISSFDNWADTRLHLLLLKISMVTPFLSHCRQLSYRVHLHEIKPWRSVAVAASDKFWDEKKCREFFSVRLGSLQSPQTFPDRFCKNKRQRQTNLFPLTPITNSPVPLGVLVSVTRFFQNLATYNNENVSNSLKFLPKKV